MARRLRAIRTERPVNRWILQPLRRVLHHSVDDESFASAKELDGHRRCRRDADRPLLVPRDAPVEPGAPIPAPKNDLGRDRALAVGRHEQPGLLDEERAGENPAGDRQRVYPRIEHAEASGLPNPPLARVPFAHVLVPDHVERRNLLPRQHCGRPVDGGCVLRVPGGIKRRAGFAGAPREIPDLADGRARGLFEQRAQPGRESLAGDLVAHIGRCADGDRVDFPRHGRDHRGQAGETGRAGVGIAVLRDHRGEAVGAVRAQRGNMLVARDLAESDQGEPDGHASARTQAIARSRTVRASSPGRYSPPPRPNPSAPASR
jgi:hypothetical protein